MFKHTLYHLRIVPSYLYVRWSRENTLKLFFDTRRVSRAAKIGIICKLQSNLHALGLPETKPEIQHRRYRVRGSRCQGGWDTLLDAFSGTVFYLYYPTHPTIHDAHSSRALLSDSDIDIRRESAFRLQMSFDMATETARAYSAYRLLPCLCGS